MFKKYPYMDAATGDEGAGGGAGGTPTAPTEPAGAAGTAAGTVLAAGIEGATFDYIPEKYHVNKEDGSFDLAASSRKLAEAYTNAEKQIGADKLPPQTPTDYKVTVPDALKEAFDVEGDEGLQGFLKDAHAAGMSQKQLDLVLGKYFDMAPKLAEGAAQYNTETASQELRKVWQNDAEFNAKVRDAATGATAIAAKAGIGVEEIMNGPLGNNPQFLRLMAAIGPEFKEDTGPAPAASQGAGDNEINSLLLSEAYTNPRHADHARVSAQVKAFFDKKYGNESV
ncbi:MAG TPA: hypothetical protein VNS29_15235 [Burkholderiaceae bacterium]|nr:hypothetical protein [Burkholderiaceae bacterium]